MMDHPHRYGIRENSLRVASCFIACCVLVSPAQATEAFFEKFVLFEEQTDGFVLFRIPGILLTARNGDPRNRRLVAFSSNGFSDWSAPRIADELKEPGCMAGVTKHSIDQDAPYKLLFSNAQTAKRKHSARRNLTIHLSRDDGFTWPVQRTIEPGPSAYSDLAVLSDGTILCFYESGVAKPNIERTRDWAYANLSLARFNLAWVKRKP